MKLYLKQNKLFKCSDSLNRWIGFKMNDNMISAHKVLVNYTGRHEGLSKRRAVSCDNQILFKNYINRPLAFIKKK